MTTLAENYINPISYPINLNDEVNMDNEFDLNDDDFLRNLLKLVQFYLDSFASTGRPGVDLSSKFSLPRLNSFDHLWIMKEQIHGENVKEDMESPRQCCSTIYSRMEMVRGKPYCNSETNVEIIRKGTHLHNINDKLNAAKECHMNMKYELDEIPVKENSDTDSFKFASGKGDLESSLDSSLDLDKLEHKIYSNISQELQTDSSYVPSLESNIKLFKTAVQEIFDNFYASMRDFEQYKRRFEEILSKRQEDSIADMEDFIIDMIHHIRSDSTNMAVGNECTVSFKSDLSLPFNDSVKESREGSKPTIEVCKNVNFNNSDTVSGPHSSSDIAPDKKVYNVYNFNGNRSVQIRLNNRDMLSEINIRDSNIKRDVIDEVASAENVQKVRAKKQEVARLRNQCEDVNAAEKDIPVKIANPKKNIHLDEDFTHDVAEDDMDKSILHKICRYFCRKLRKY